MAIPQEEYINITSGVVKDAVSNRELIGRVLVSDEITPLYALEFTSLASVASYYGQNSHQYNFAEKYFNFISKDIKKPKKLSFCKYIKPEGTAIKSAVFSKLGWNGGGEPNVGTEGDTMFDLKLKTLDAEYYFSVDSPYQQYNWTELAEHIQTQMRGVLDSVEVKYISDPQRLLFTFGVTEKIEVTVTGQYASYLGLNTPVVVQGMDAPETWSQMMDWVDDSNNNFGTFCFLTSSLSTDDIVDISTWNNGKNVKYMYVQTVESENVFGALKDIGGTWLQLTNAINDDDKENDKIVSYDAFAPMAIGATLNYNRVNTNAFFDFYPVPGMDILVDNVNDFNKYTKARTNFNGATQQAGREIAFLQPGYLTGAISDAGVYYNEMWLKDDIGTKLMALFLAVKKIPANEVGKMQCKNAIMTTIEQAKVNGSILVGKTLTNAQKAQIQEYTADDNAVNKIQDLVC